MKIFPWFFALGVLAIGCGAERPEAMFYGARLQTVGVNPSESVVVAERGSSGLLVWDFENEPLEFYPDDHEVSQIVFVDDQHAYINARPNPVYRLDYRTRAAEALPEGTPSLPWDPVITDQGLIFAMLDGDLVLWDPTAPTEVDPIPQSAAITAGDGIEDFDVTDDYYFILRDVGDEGSAIEAWDRSDAAAERPAAIAEPVRRSTLTVDSTNNVYTMRDTGPEIWNPANGATVQTNIPVERIKPLVAGELIIGLDLDGSVIIDVRSNEVVSTHDSYYIYDVIHLDDGRVLVNGIGGRTDDKRYAQPDDDRLESWASLQVWELDDLIGRSS